MALIHSYYNVVRVCTVQWTLDTTLHHEYVVFPVARSDNVPVQDHIHHEDRNQIYATHIENIAQSDNGNTRTRKHIQTHTKTHTDMRTWSVYQ